MKKHYTFFYLILFAGMAIAQPTITYSALPVVGTIHSANNDTIGNLLWIDSGGINKSWDYTSAFTIHTQSSDTFKDVSLANYSATFPNSNLFYPVGGSYEDFFITDSTGFYWDGETAGSMVILDGEPDELLMPVPFTYQQTIKDTSHYKYTVGMGYVSIQTIKTFEADAYGTLTTPAGTFNDVLRLKIIHEEIDSGVNIAPGSITTYNDMWTEYKWCAVPAVPAMPGSYYPSFSLMSISLDSNGIISGGSYYSGLLTSKEEYVVEQNNIVTYPNPASNTINWVLNVSNGSIKVFDIKAIEIDVVLVKDRNPKMDISSFSNGLYLYEYYDENGNKMAAGEFIKN